MNAQPPVALTIAGSDSGGGAGIQADLRTFAAHGVFGTSAITAVTAQNTLGVGAVHQVPPDVVVAQVRAVLEDLPVAAVKTGMLGSRAVVEAVADLAARGLLPNLVVDPVAVATSGDRLLDVDAERAYVELLLPHTAVLTPNEREAGVLLGRPVVTLADRRQAAADLAALGPRVVVVTGGDGDAGAYGDAYVDAYADAGTDAGAGTAVDVVWLDGTTTQMACPRVPTTNTHGTGCTYSAALAAALAHGLPLQVALEQAKSYVHRALTAGTGRRLGSGSGPVDPLGTPAGCRTSTVVAQ